tara:strand:+ start:407 stop:532 length:126 start_codon:yes stop_codon:yes gene_type:complete
MDRKLDKVGSMEYNIKKIFLVLALVSSGTSIYAGAMSKISF